MSLPTDQLLPADDVFDAAFSWRDAGKPVALATVVSTWGSSPRPPGSHLGVSADGEMTGSVSGGCIEGAVVKEALDILKGTPARVLDFGVTDQQAWDVGLACGGAVKVLVRDFAASAPLYAKARAALASGETTALVTRLDGGETVMLGAGDLPGAVAEAARKALADDRSRAYSGDDGDWFIEVVAPPRRLIVVGAVHIAQALVPMAAMTGFRVTVVDPRRAYASDTRFPGVDVRTDWPDEALDELKPDSRTAIVTLTHDPKLDDPALDRALQSQAFYIGSLGSSRTQAKRVERLTEAGFDAAAIGRIHGPVGLRIGAQSPAEIAVSILAEIIARMRQTPD
jgi:xanthine dehydrogenase accessory factor